MRLSFPFVAFLAFLLVPGLAPAIELGQLDDFQDGLQDWRSGNNNPNGPEAVMNLGPDGIGDWAMKITGNGGGAGGALVVFNQEQWSGDYLAAGVTAVRFDLKNLSEVDLVVRVALRGASGSVASQASFLPAGGDYRSVTLSLRAADLTAIGDADPAAVLANVSEMRIRHADLPTTTGDSIAAMMAVDNVEAVSTLDCTDGLKADFPAGLLFLPAFEVDTASDGGLTTFFSIHNRLDEAAVARISYFDRSSNLQRQEDLDFSAHRTLTLNVRNALADLAVDDDGFARGWIQIQSCFAEVTEATPQLWGDWFLVDFDGNFATGDQLLRADDVCEQLELRLVDLGSGVRLRLFVTNPQGAESQTPTATLTVYNEPGQMQETRQVFTDDSVLTLTLGDLVKTRFGMLRIDFTEGGGAASVEYSAFGKYSVAMNANCIAP